MGQAVKLVSKDLLQRVVGNIPAKNRVHRVFFFPDTFTTLESRDIPIGKTTPVLPWTLKFLLFLGSWILHYLIRYVLTALGTR